jgi:hypothetical protein
MAALAKQVIGPKLVPAYTPAAGGGDTFVPGDQTFVHAKNGSGGVITITVADALTPVPAGSAAVNNFVQTVAAGGEAMLGPFPASRFAQPAGGTPGSANMTYSGVTSLTVAVITT